MKKTYLVVGGAGFLGANMIERLLSEGNKVICLDNLLTGVLENIAQFKSDPDFKFIKHDIIKSLTLPGKIDYILNYACPASPIDYRKYPIETLEVSSIGVKNMLEFAKQKKARFFHQ